MAAMRILTGVALLLVCMMTSLVVAQNPKPPTLTDSPECDDCVTLIYDPATGNLSFTVASPDPNDQNKLTTLEMRSQGALFDQSSSWCVCEFFCNPFCTEQCQAQGFDMCWSTVERIVLISFMGFDSFEFDNIPLTLPAGLPSDEIASDLIVDGTYLTGGWLDKYNPDSPFLYVVPEPSTALLSSLCIVVLLLPRRRR